MKNIYVTKPVLPNHIEYSKKIEKIWQSKQLTNNGEFLDTFEKELQSYLKVSNISLMSNGTLALLIALKVFDLKGEVITTPYSFVATTHVLDWLNLKPVFCDIEPNTCNIDPDKIEALVTEDTCAILPVHVYGNPCDHIRIQQIADKYNLKVIYDAAHAFGVEKDAESILNWGDASILSFHATKVFNTVEGGAIIIGDNNSYGCAKVRRCEDAIQSPITNHQSRSIIRRVELLRNFGIVNEEEVELAGINAKMNELIAAYGLLQLETIDEEIEKRKIIVKRYREALCDVKGIRLLEVKQEVKYNYSYFPVFIEKDRYGISRDELYNKLREKRIFARKYFYPLISNIPMYRGLRSADPGRLPVANRIANDVLCLPLYGELSLDDQNRVTHKIKTETI